MEMLLDNVFVRKDILTFIKIVYVYNVQHFGKNKYK